MYVCMYVYGELVYRPSLLSDPVIDEIDNKSLFVSWVSLLLLTNKITNHVCSKQIEAV